MAQGLWDVVSQSLKGTKEPEKPTATGSTTQQPDLKTDAKASTIIMGLCSHDTLQHILLLESAHEQWEALKELYQPLGQQQLGVKIQAFQAYTPPKNASVTTIATDLNTLQAEIGDIDTQERPSDRSKIAVFLRAIRVLDPRFDPLVLQLEISGLATNYSVVVTKITEFERRMSPRETIKEDAYSASDSKPRPKPKFRGKCHNCGKIGHMARDCRASKSTESSKRDPSTGPLPTPTGGRGLSPTPNGHAARQATEEAWAVTIEGHTQGLRSRNELLWVVDSGASRHMTFCREAFTEYAKLRSPITINTANGAEIQAVGTGTVVLKVPRDGIVRTVNLTEVLYVPGLVGSLLSVVQLQDKGITVRTAAGQKLLLERQGKPLGEAKRLGKAYVLYGVVPPPETALSATTDATAKLAHRRLGHLSSGALQHIEKVTTGLTNPVASLKEPCEPCIRAKAVG